MTEGQGTQPPPGHPQGRRRRHHSGRLDGTTDTDRLRRRALFLHERNEARELRERVQPRRARTARLRQSMRMRAFRW